MIRRRGDDERRLFETRSGQKRSDTDEQGGGRIVVVCRGGARDITTSGGWRAVKELSRQTLYTAGVWGMKTSEGWR